MGALRIDGEEIYRDLEALSAFSAAGPGVTRLPWTEELRAANRWLEERVERLGLAVRTDAAGNVFGDWEVGAGTPVLVGSHLDSVPQGGRFDGALGVVGALHAIAAMQEAGIAPRRPIRVVSWTDEEGPRFGTGMLGSRAFAGDDLSGLGDRADATGVTLREAMGGFGLDSERLGDARGIDGAGEYLELHIEQGSRLEQAEIDVGVVTGVVGLMSFDVTFTGAANHAGTTTMEARRDALAAAARTTLAVRERALAQPAMVANVGSISAYPGAANVVPGRAEMTVEMRHPDRAVWERIPAIVRDEAERAAAAERVTVEVAERHRLAPAVFDERLIETFERAAELEGASTTRLVSGAGHDGMTLAAHIPVAMIFVPSRDGISHSPDEHTDPEACALGARVLARALVLRAIEA
jgi:allantoate deiminase